MKKNNTTPIKGLIIPILYLAACESESDFVDEAEWSYFSKYVAYSWFIVEDDFTITAFGPSAPKIFKRTPETLLHSDFEQLLLRGAAHRWRDLVSSIRKGRLPGMTLHQKYHAANGQVLHSISSLCDYKGSRILVKIHIPVAFYPERNPKRPIQTPETIPLSVADWALVEAVRDYIHNHLDDRLPSTKALSHQFYTNEYTLKLRFRQAYGCSIYKYFNGKRLDRAHELISKGAHTLQDIAVMSGFATYRNFSTAFKKHIGCSPSTILRSKR